MGATNLCCCLRLSSKRWNRNSNRELDERFGDMSISGPTSGSWNQAPPGAHTCSQSSSNSSPRQDFSKSGDLEKSTPKKRWSDAFHSSRGSHSTQGSPQMTKDVDDTASTGASEKPAVVYKPASGDFLKSISEISRSRNPQQSQEPPVTQQQVHSRPASIQSASTTQHSSPGAIPRHPSYQTGLRTPSPEMHPSSSPQPPSNRVSSALDRRMGSRRQAWSPSISSLASADEYNNKGITDAENSEARQALPPPNPIPTATPSLLRNSTKKKQKPRKVTEELVPSTHELFG